MLINILFSIISGILLALTFPKFNLFWLAWVALVPFFMALSKAEEAKEFLLYGALFGLSFFGIHLFCITPLFRFVGWWSMLAWLTFAVYLTLFILVFVILVRLLIFPRKGKAPASEHGAVANALVARRKRKRESIWRSIFMALAWAGLWTLVEWIRALGPFGTTNGGVGYSQVQLLPLIQISSFASVYGVTFLVVLVNISLMFFLFNFKRWQPLFLSLILVLGAGGYGWRVMNSSSLDLPAASLTSVLRGAPVARKIALIQPNIDQKDKLDISLIASIFEKHEEMTRQAARQNPDIIIWPETAVTAYLLHDPVLLPRLKKLAIQSKAWLIVGTPHYVGNKIYNSVVSISPQGEIVTRYDKEQLVPFGEYLPLRPVLYPILKRVGYFDSAYNSNPDPKPLLAGDINIAAAICFESIFPHLIQKRVTKQTDLILLVTNDAWFGDSSALYFHINAGVFRAIENRRYFVEVGNTGVSAVIDPYGRILKKTRVNEQKILFLEIPLS